MRKYDSRVAILVLRSVGQQQPHLYQSPAVRRRRCCLPPTARGIGDDRVRGTEDYVQTTGTSAEAVVTSPTVDLNAVPENVGRNILFSFTLPAPAGSAVMSTLL